MSRITFERQFLKPGQMAAHGRSGPSTSNTFERAEANRVGKILTRLGVPQKTKFQLINEAQEFSDILSSNPGLLAGALLFYVRSGQRFSVDLFRKLGPELVRELVAADAFVPAYATGTKKEENEEEEDDASEQPVTSSDKEAWTHYGPGLFRTVIQLGQERGVEGTTDLF
jgi:hypothetical protein